MKHITLARDFTTLTAATFVGAACFLAFTPLRDASPFVPLKAGITVVGFLTAVAAATVCLWIGFGRETTQDQSTDKNV